MSNIDTQSSEDRLLRALQCDENNSQTVGDEFGCDEVETSGTFKKKPWLHKFFGLRTVEGKSVIVYCRGCQIEYKSRSIPRLMHRYENCKMTTRDSSMEEYESDNPVTQAWIKVILENNISLRSIESTSFKSFVKLACKSWKTPSRRELSTTYIPKMSRVLHTEFIEKIKKYRIENLTIEFDHWEDGVGRSYMGIIATNCTGNRYLLDLKDVSLKGHSSSVIVEELVETLKILPSKSVSAIISDSAANCKKARRDFVGLPEFKHVIQHRCLAHLFNLIGARVTNKNEKISATVQKASSITNIISSSSYWQAYINNLGHRKTKPSCNVRWYSSVNMMLALVELKDVVMEKILPLLPNDKAHVVATLDWYHLTEILEVLKPLNSCIGKLEQKDISLGEGFRVILEYAKDLFQNCPHSEVTIEARNSFLHYFNKIERIELGIYIAAYVLDKRNKLNFISEEGIDLVLEVVTRIALNSGVTLATLNMCLFNDFECYRKFKEDYAATRNEDRPIEWWLDRQARGLLATVGLRLAHLKASSANIERMFSTLKLIQGGGRLNLSTNLLVDIARLKIFHHELNNMDYDASERNELSNTGSFDDSIESSFSSFNSSSSSSRQECSDNSNWIEEQNTEAKQAYQKFFKYIDFSVIYENSHGLSGDTSSELSDEQIRKFVKFNREMRMTTQTDVILEQPQDNDVIYLDSQPI